MKNSSTANSFYERQLDFNKFKNIIGKCGTINGCNRWGYLRPKQSIQICL